MPGHELHQVLVGRDEHHSYLRRSLPGERAEHVVAVPRELDHRDPERAERLADPGQLRPQPLGHRRPVGLVVGVPLGADGDVGDVPRHADELRVLLAQQLAEHLHEAVDGVRRLSLRRRELPDRIEGAEGVGETVDQVEAGAGGHAPSLCAPAAGVDSGYGTLPRLLPDMSRARSDSADKTGAPRPARRRHRDPRSLPLYGVYRRFRNLAFGAPVATDDEGLARLLFQALVEEIPTASPIRGVRLYLSEGDDFVLLDRNGDAGEVTPGYRVPATHPVIVQSLHDGWALVRRGDSRYDEWVARTGGDHAVAKLLLGPARNLLLSFTLREPIATAEVANALTALGSLADSARARQRFQHVLEQAREVQTSLLPRSLPAIPGFELAVRQRPAEIVGGDVYDLIRVGDDALAVCIADATGHGLPAALQARDVIVGLRMGMALQLKMVAIVDRLSRVLADSSPVGRYVSFFFAEIDGDGHLIYLNAGHPPPLLIGRERRGHERLRTRARSSPRPQKPPVPGYGSSNARAGDLLVLYTTASPRFNSPDTRNTVREAPAFLAAPRQRTAHPARRLLFGDRRLAAATRRSRPDFCCSCAAADLAVPRHRPRHPVTLGHERKAGFEDGHSSLARDRSPGWRARPLPAPASSGWAAFATTAVGCSRSARGFLAHLLGFGGISGFDLRSWRSPPRALLLLSSSASARPPVISAPARRAAAARSADRMPSHVPDDRVPRCAD